VLVRGLPEGVVTEDDGPGAASLIRPEGEDLFGLGSREAVVAALSREPSPRGFPESDASVQDLLDLADVPDGLTVTLQGTSCQISTDAGGLVAAGELRQRLLALAGAHGIELTVDVKLAH
jgi:coenzyme F420-0:L-glutamate ligase/coenzyme F420-1:gamma-L-glutamate ligase